MAQRIYCQTAQKSDVAKLSLFARYTVAVFSPYGCELGSSIIRSVGAAAEDLLLCPQRLAMRQTLKYLWCLCWGIEVPCWRRVKPLSCLLLQTRGRQVTRHKCGLQSVVHWWYGVKLMLSERRMFWSSSVAFIQSVCYLTEKHDFSQTWFKSAPLFHQIREMMVGRDYCRSLVQPRAWSKTVANTRSGQLGFCPDKSWRKILKNRDSTHLLPRLHYVPSGKVFPS